MQIKIVSPKFDDKTVEKLQKETDELVRLNSSPHAVMYYISEKYKYSTSLVYNDDRIAIVRAY